MSKADDMLEALRRAQTDILEHCGCIRLLDIYPLRDESDVIMWEVDGDDVKFTYDQPDDEYSVSLYGGRSGHLDAKGKPQGEPTWRGDALSVLLVHDDNGGGPFLMLVRSEAEQSD